MLLVDTNALRNQFSCEFLCAFDLIPAANPSRQNASAQKDLSRGCWLEPFCVWSLSASTPQRTHDLQSTCLIRFVFFLQRNLASGQSFLVPRQMRRVELW